MRPGDRRPKVLIVEDNDDLRELLSFELRGSGFGVTPVGTALDALDVLQTTAGIACALIDLNLPWMSGAQLIERMQHLEHRPPVIVMTGYDVTRLPGAYALLRKPFERELMVETIARALSSDTAQALESA